MITNYRSKNYQVNKKILKEYNIIEKKNHTLFVNLYGLPRRATINP